MVTDLSFKYVILLTRSYPMNDTIFYFVDDLFKV